MKAFDRWYDGHASLKLDYWTARSLWKTARKSRNKWKKLYMELKATTIPVAFWTDKANRDKI